MPGQVRKRSEGERSPAVEGETRPSTLEELERPAVRGGVDETDAVEKAEDDEDDEDEDEDEDDEEDDDEDEDEDEDDEDDEDEEDEDAAEEPADR
jgi:hypothetical protein